MMMSLVKMTKITKRLLTKNPSTLMAEIGSRHRQSYRSMGVHLTPMENLRGS